MRDAGHTTREAQCISARVDLESVHGVNDDQRRSDRLADPGQDARDAHTWLAGVDLCAAQSRLDTQVADGGAPSCGDQYTLDDHRSDVAAPYDALLLILADAVDDLERVRIATDNRIRSLTQVKGLEDSPETQRLAAMRDSIAALEHSATLDLQRAMRAHPLGSWVKRTVGVGEKQAARLLAAIDDPADRGNPAKLWQYCGHGDPARSHCRKGRPVEHSPMAKMRVRMVAESVIKAGVRKADGCDDSDGYDLAHRYSRTGLGALYLRERAKWADRDTTDLHKHNHALRVVGKAMLLDLWREARNLRGDQTHVDTRVRGVPVDLRSDQSDLGTQTSRVAADLPPTSEPTTTNLEPSAAQLEEQTT